MARQRALRLRPTAEGRWSCLLQKLSGNYCWRYDDFVGTGVKCMANAKVNGMVCHH